MATFPLRVDFRSGLPDLSAFPQKEWAMTYRQVCSALPAKAFGYADPEGEPELREAIARYLLRSRGIVCAPERVMITSGSTQGLWLMARLLRRRGSTALVEDPAHRGMLKVMAGAGYAVKGIRADRDGMDVSLLEPVPSLGLIYATPSHQYPLGGILPVQRRLALLRFARDTDSYVIEDDYDSEFRYAGSPVSALYELAPERVVYLGSFSKILAPALRLGFALLPDALRAAWKPEKIYTDVHTDAVSQRVLAAFINSGRLEKHIWKMKKLYRRKRDCLLRLLREHFGDAVWVEGHEAGLHLTAEFKGLCFDQALLREIRAKGVRVVSVERHSVSGDGSHCSKLIIGYAHLTAAETAEGLRLLHQALTARRQKLPAPE